MSTLSIVATVLLIALAGYFMGRARAMRLSGEEGVKLHSRPVYHGSYVFSLSLIHI